MNIRPRRSASRNPAGPPCLIKPPAHVGGGRGLEALPLLLRHTRQIAASASRPPMRRRATRDEQRQAEDAPAMVVGRRAGPVRRLFGFDVDTSVPSSAFHVARSRDAAGRTPVRRRPEPDARRPAPPGRSYRPKYAASRFRADPVVRQAHTRETRVEGPPEEQRVAVRRTITADDLEHARRSGRDAALWRRERIGCGSPLAGALFANRRSSVSRDDHFASQ